MRKLTIRLGLCSAVLVAGVLAGGCSGSGAGSTGLTAAGAKDGANGAQASRVNSLLQTGINQAEKHDSAGAQSTFQQVLALEPDNKFAWFDLALVAQGQGDSGTALADYSKALQTDPAFTSALYNKALLIQSSDAAQAEQLLRAAIAADPKASTAYLHLGLLLQKTDSESASAAFGKAVALDPSLAKFVPAGALPSGAGTDGGAGAGS